MFDKHALAVLFTIERIKRLEGEICVLSREKEGEIIPFSLTQLHRNYTDKKTTKEKGCQLIG